MKNLHPTKPNPTNIHFGLPQYANDFGNDTIHLFEPAPKKNQIGWAIKKAVGTNNVSIVEKTINQLLAKDQSPYMMSSIMAALGDNKVRKALFSMYLAASEDLRNKILSNSYMHDNGFEKWVLINNPAYKLRLHIYEDSRLVPQENRHNHSWDFASCIVEGCLQNTIYTNDEANGEEELFHYQYSPIEGDAYGTKFLNKTRLRKMSDINLSQGTAYFMPAEVVHRISYEQTFKQRTITFMLTGNRKNYNCDLFSEHKFTEEKKLTKRFSAEEMDSRFREMSKL